MPPVLEQTGLNGIDIAILAIVLVSAGISLLRGFFKEAISLVTWVAAFWVAVTFSTDQAKFFESLIQTPSLRAATSFGVLFLVTLILGSLINKAMQEVIDFTGFGGMDSVLGMLFGIARGLLIISMLVMVAGMTPLPEDLWWQESALLEHFQQISGWLLEQLPEDLRNYFPYTSR
jgi:membrane protein required for colicin V production